MQIRDAEHSRAPVVLASASPRRRDLLRLLGISFSVQIADLDESPLPGEAPGELARRLAQAKALTIARAGPPATRSDEFPYVSQSSVEHRHHAVTAPTEARTVLPADAVILAADTVVALDDVILGKPADDAEARSMLDALRGRAHRVLTSVALAVAGEIVRTSLVETRVWMRKYGADEVERYIRSGSPFDKAGAYGIQDVDFRPVERIEGCFTNVVGLPLCEVRAALTALDPSQPSAGLADGGTCELCERAYAAASRP